MKMKKLVTLFVGVTLMASSGVVLAQETKTTESKSVTEFDFDDDLIKGGTVSPAMERIVSKRGEAKKSLIKVRKHFVNEMIVSVDEI